MNKPSQNNSSSQFLKTDRGKTKSNAIEIPSISLPKGGGAIKGIDEKFSVNAVNGTASFSIPLPFSPARGASPALSLSYNSGAGNGIFGIGWMLDLPSIKRKTDKGIPRYMDAEDSDIFLFSDSEDLVPEFKREIDGSFLVDTNGNYILKEDGSTDPKYLIRSFKPRIEGLFARIERWTEKTTAITKWRVITRDNVTTLFGWSSDSVIADPKDNTKIYEWLPEFVFDDKGNCSRYVYKKEDAIDFNNSLLHNRNRIENGSINYNNLYPEKVLYGNKTPYINFGSAYPAEAEFMFQTVFDYGEYDNSSPFEKIKGWDFRVDAFSDYKSGFEIRTTRLCKRILLFHYFSDLPGGSALIKSTNFKYDTASDQDFTFLKSIKNLGYIKKADGSYTSKELPATEFEYQQHDWNKEVKTISSEALVHAPTGFDQLPYQFTDLYNEGLAGILSEQGNAWYYKHNLGDGKFEQARLVTPKPSFTGLGGQLQLMDLDADGGKQLVNLGLEPKGFFELDDNNEWQAFKHFKKLPAIDFGDPYSRILDLDGDGKPEILITEDNVFTWYQSDGRNGFSKVYRTQKSFDEESGPAIVFADVKQTIFLADMSGDGMTDIVRIRNGKVCYWPNLGYGQFGKKVAMDNSPVLDSVDAFNPAYIKLADLDGSGTTDIIYLGKNKFTCWLNLSGNAFSTTPFEIDAFPEVHTHATVTVTDLLGNGVACIVWSSNLSKDTNSPLRYIDLMNSKKPHILVSYKNNFGKEVLLNYTPSTKFYIEDKLAGKPWATKIHFPVHCISKIETLDKISGYRFTSSYKYHHGYYDHAEREFRGFGMVEQIDSEHFEHWVNVNATNIVNEELHQEPVVSKTWFHTGAFFSSENILNQFADEYWYAEMVRLGYPVTHNEADLPDAHLIAAPGIDPAILAHLSAQEWQEALRACKGMALRSETFAKDAIKFSNTDKARQKELTPFSVATHNCVIELLQPKGKNKHAVFIVKECEAITYSYERNPEDPRVAHNLNIKLDEYGNVLESALVVYPRLLQDADLPVETQQVQNKTVIIYNQNQFTNDVYSEDEYRLRLPSEIKIFELKGVEKTSAYYKPADFENVLSDAVSDFALYHELEKQPSQGKAQKRLIEHARTNYLKNDLSGPLPLNRLESLALPFESYQLAYTPELLTDIYAAKADDIVLADLMVASKFCHSIDENGTEDNNWWVRSGTMQFLQSTETASDAQARFYLPVSYTDPYSAVTKIKYGDDFLFIKEAEDALGNKTAVEAFNFRTLSPVRLKDINGNISVAITDELGLVKAVAVMGKGEQADDLLGLEEITENEQADIAAFFQVANALDICDSAALQSNARKLLKNATTRFVYDFNVYVNTGKPAVVSSIIRETHVRKEDGSMNLESKLQVGFEYSNGLGQVIMKKLQAEPGIAYQSDGMGNRIDINTNSSLRWLGNGRTILNNAGNPVKQYEPYFSISPKFENESELVETGFTPVMYYDAMSRLIKTEMPNGTFSKVEFDSWKQKVYDANDTVLDLGNKWYSNRINGGLGDKEKQAAQKAAKHANTPNTLHIDTLGRHVLSIEHNRDIVTESNEFYHTKVILDTEGNLLNVMDARELAENAMKGNTVMQYKYDMLGNLVYQNSMDAGQRWLLINILGNPLCTWDERGHEFKYFYDILHRPIESKIIGGDMQLNHVFDRIFYGEGEPDAELKNLRGKVLRHYDTGGLVETKEYDFKGQAKSTSRWLFKDYKSVANWIDSNLTTDLENDEFKYITETDALGRITSQTAPDGSIVTTFYNEAGLLNAENVSHLNPAITTTYIKDIDYNEKGQRKKIIYGNDVITSYEYDKETLRLKHLLSKKKNNEVLQDLHYYYDAVGNITTIQDENIPDVFFRNQLIEGIFEYEYDALYRLVIATGREQNTNPNFNTEDNWNDAPYMSIRDFSDPLALRKYTQTYQYDSVGNIKLMKHMADNGNWTRRYDYETTTNRLISTVVSDVATPANYTNYLHHPQHGYMLEMPHLQEMGWNFKEELVKTIKQKVNPSNGTAETTYYQYDGSGQRIRKITENQASTGNIPTKKQERIYIAGYETYRTFQANTLNFERESLSLMDAGHRFVMVETVKANTDLNPSLSERVGERLIRYQLHNHLGSASLELDNTAQIISYEEYYPYGTTAYQAKNSAIKSAAKRYRYTGMERDEETGLEYHGARYYLPWLGRWLSSDPAGLIDGANVFRFSRNSPLTLFDPTGMKPMRVGFIKVDDVPNLPSADGVNRAEVTILDEDRSRTVVTTIDQVLSSGAYVDNGIVSTGADIDNLTYARVTALNLKYSNKPDAKIPLSSIDLDSTVAASMFLQIGGVIYPVASDYTMALNGLNTPNLARHMLMKLDQRTELLAQREEIAWTVYAFSESIKSLGHAASAKISWTKMSKQDNSKKPNSGGIKGAKSGGEHVSKFNQTSREQGGLENCVRCVTSLVDTIVNKGFLKPARGYPSAGKFPTTKKALEYISGETMVQFAPRPLAGRLGTAGDYVVFNRFAQGRPGHILWARVKADGRQYFYDPQSDKSLSSHDVGAYVAYKIIYPK